MQFFEAKSFDQGLLRQSLLGKYIGGARGSLFALGWVKQNELLNFRQFFQQLFERQIGPRGSRLLVKIVQQRDAEHAIESVNPNFAIRPVMHGIPTQPVSILQSAEHAFDR